MNTSWYGYMKTVNNLRVYDPRSPEFKRLLNHLQNAEIIEASMYLVSWIIRNMNISNSI